MISGVQIFPQDHVWNVPVDDLPVDARSADYVSSIGRTGSLHPDFGADLDGTGPIGIPYNIVNNTVTKKTVIFDYGDESDPGPYPIPANPLIEGGAACTGDCHILMLQTDEKKLYELFAAHKQPNGTWEAGRERSSTSPGTNSGRTGGHRRMLQVLRCCPASLPV